MSAGRTCPLDYRYGAESLRGQVPAATSALYVVGGLYGNLPALGAVLALFARESAPDKRLVFNGDFHWFDTDLSVFEAITHAVLRHDATRGNVETQLAGGSDAGCGCGYPEWVDQGTVERSNAIMERLATMAAALPTARERMAMLPMTLRYRVGDARVAVVHGDADSLAGWGFAQEHLNDMAHLPVVSRWFEQADTDIFACSHTCLPVLRAVGRHRWVVNNGAAGMPNFAGQRYGLLTRIATSPFTGPERVHGVADNGVHIDALAVRYDVDAFASQFLAAWPPGSAAYVSYWTRIANGPAYEPARAYRGCDAACPDERAAGTATERFAAGAR